MLMAVLPTFTVNIGSISFCLCEAAPMNLPSRFTVLTGTVRSVRPRTFLAWETGLKPPLFYF
jgi:hypothetical protein